MAAPPHLLDRAVNETCSDWLTMPAFAAQIVLRGCYQVLLKRLLSVFSRQQLYVIRSEDMYADKNFTILGDLMEHVGLPRAAFTLQDSHRRPGRCKVVGQLVSSGDIAVLQDFYDQRGDRDLRSLLGDPRLVWESEARQL